MGIKIKITALALGLLLAQGAVGWGQEQLSEQHFIMRQYRANLKRIPPTLPPEQRRILEHRFKHQMQLDRWQSRVKSRNKTTAPAETTANH